MAGFKIPLPLTEFTPQMLAEMAQRAFRPPALMGGGGGGGGGGGLGVSGAAAPGFNAQDAAGAAGGLGMLAKGLMADKGVSGMPETAAVGPGGLSGAVSGIEALQPGPGGQFAPPPMPTDIGSGGGGGLFSGLFGGGRADGGEVMPGKYYTVGERGPETFVPAVPGTIVPAWEGARTIPDPMDLATSRQRIMDWERDFFGGRKLRR